MSDLFNTYRSQLRHPHYFPTRRSSDLGGRAAFASWNRERVLVCEKRLGAWKLVYDLDASTSLGPAAFSSRVALDGDLLVVGADRKSTRLNSSHTVISYAGFCLKKKKIT